MPKFGISQPVRRVEDARFLTGQGRFVDDLSLPGQTCGYVLRSPHAHAAIRSIDTTHAAKQPGVLAVITGADLTKDGVGALPCFADVKNRDGSKLEVPKRFPLAVDMVRFVGDPVAFVVAETLAQARDAAEAIVIDYAPRPATVDLATALAPGQPQVHEARPDNLAFDWEFGDAAEVEKAFAGAARVVRLPLINNRLVASPMETRGVIATVEGGRVVVHTGNQGPWTIRSLLAQRVLKVGPQDVRVMTPDVGGAFGAKIFYYPEHALVAWSTRRLGRPVKWVADRSESFLSDAQGRDHITTAEIAFSSDHRIVGYRVDTIANMGAYLSEYGPEIPTSAALKVLPGIYDVKCVHYRVRGAYTHTVPVDAYRGAGRPEAIYQIERLMDEAAAELGIDRVALRRRNFVPASEFPFKTAVGEIYDSGDFGRVLDTALAKADWAGFAGRRRTAATQGKRRGIGLGYFIEATMGGPDESAGIRFTPEDRVEILVGTQSSGQGHETAYAQVLHERLGVPIDAIDLVQGDTDRIASGGGTGGSRSLTAEAWAIDAASNKVIEKATPLAANVLDAPDVEFHDGMFRVPGTDRTISVLDLAARLRASGSNASLDADAKITVPAWTFPNGCHVAEVEIDEDTGVPTLVAYTIVDDFGRIMNPLLVEGQVDGGVVQGIGQALFEHARYGEDGQFLSASFLDYCLPRAADLPHLEFSTVEVPCRNNPFGVKGCGEAGAIASPPAVINAIADALGGKQRVHIDMPATAEKLWRLLQAR
ncbi:MAG: xanthine dehydrogenase family protein molybdopterin-binding subunit [Rhodospirillales bacterium]|nr:xanthine dehydrogenase family protein molybdopterin-binding subunit [Rhodospirillales bacterium]